MNKLLAFTFAAFLPLSVSAQTSEPLQNAVSGALGLVQQLLPLVVTLALLFFFWNIIKFIFNLSKGEDSQTAGRSALFWGIVALFVMVSIWGIVGLLGEIFGVGQGGTAPVPGLDIPQED